MSGKERLAYDILADGLDGGDGAVVVTTGDGAGASSRSSGRSARPRRLPLGDTDATGTVARTRRCSVPLTRITSLRAVIALGIGIGIPAALGGGTTPATNRAVSPSSRCRQC